MVGGRARVLERVSVPAVIWVVPPKVFRAVRVSSAAPALMRLNAPVQIPVREPALVTLRVVLAKSCAEPLRVRVPVLEPSPSPTVPERESEFARERAVLESLERRPPESVRVPVPRAELLPIWSEPAERLTPPVKPFGEVRVCVPVPVLARLPEPLREPLKVALPVPPRVRAFVPSNTTPLPPKDETVPLVFKSTEPAEPTVSATPLVRAVPPESIRLPPVTAIVPVNVLAPVRVRLPRPALVRVIPVPLSVPPRLRVTLGEIIEKVPVEALTVPLSVPLLKPENLTSPWVLTELATATVPLEKSREAPWARVKVPVPRGPEFTVEPGAVRSEFASSSSPPALTLTPPVKVLEALLSCSTPLPVFRREAPEPVSLERRMREGFVSV